MCVAGYWCVIYVVSCWWDPVAREQGGGDDFTIMASTDSAALYSKIVWAHTSW